MKAASYLSILPAANPIKRVKPEDILDSGIMKSPSSQVSIDASIKANILQNAMHLPVKKLGTQVNQNLSGFPSSLIFLNGAVNESEIEDDTGPCSQNWIK